MASSSSFRRAVCCPAWWRYSLSGTMMFLMGCSAGVGTGAARVGLVGDPGGAAFERGTAVAPRRLGGRDHGGEGGEQQQGVLQGGVESAVAVLGRRDDPLRGVGPGVACLQVG